MPLWGVILFDELRAQSPLRAVYWKDLRPGLVFAGGLSINGCPPAELSAYPVLTSSLISALHERYKLSPDKRVLAYSGDGDLSPSEFSQALRSASARLVPLNLFRADIRNLKKAQPTPEVAVWDSAWVERGSLIWPLRSMVPTFLADLTRDIGIVDVLKGEVFSRFRLPADKPVAVHLVVDQSYSMSASGKDQLTRSTVNLFRGKLSQLLPLADVTVYAFSEECRVVTGSLTGKEVRRAGTDFSSFVKIVLRRLKSDRPNAVLLFTDGLPDDRRAAERELERFSRALAFYTQIVFNLRGDRVSYAVGSSDQSLDGYAAGPELEGAIELSPEEYQTQEADFRLGFSSLARAAGGNQLILTVDDALSLASVEVFDRWYGGLVN
ncbi:MAG: vWA domain-containing protein [Treponemataceae bacterium]